MRNPFKTKIILYITPRRMIKTIIPFLGKVRQEIIRREKIKGEKIDILICDEAVEWLK